MRDLLVSVPACNKEHCSTVGNSSNNSTSGNTRTSGINFTARTHVAAHSTAILSVTSWRREIFAGPRGAILNRVASSKREGCVDNAGEAVDGLFLIVPEGI